MSLDENGRFDRHGRAMIYTLIGDPRTNDYVLNGRQPLPQDGDFWAPGDENGPFFKLENGEWNEIDYIPYDDENYNG